MIVTGLVIRTVPDKFDTVLVAVENVRSVSITKVIAENKLLAIINAKDKQEEGAVSEEIKRIDGVESINLAYQHVET